MFEFSKLCRVWLALVIFTLLVARPAHAQQSAALAKPQQSDGPSTTVTPPQQPAPAPSDAQTAEASDDDTSSGIQPPESIFPHFSNTRYWLSGQANFVYQTHPSFTAPYSGPHSLFPDYQKAVSRVLTLYTGFRFTNTFEILADLEEAGGDALSAGFGLAGNTDLDIVRNPMLSKAPYLGRGILHKVFALSSEAIKNDRNYLSLFDSLPRRRIEVRFGKFSMPDFMETTRSAPIPTSSSSTGLPTTTAHGTTPPTPAATPSAG